jgi:acetylornithine deacetylase
MAALTTTTKAILERLIRFDTTSNKSNLNLVEYIRSYLQDFGIGATLIPDGTGTKAALYTTIGPSVEGGVVLSAHTDVVPTAGQEWTNDPFQMTLRDAKLYGRGSTDMKGFIACVLAHVPQFVASPLKRPIHIALSYDEEVGCLGVRPLSKQMASRVPTPMAVIVGEPTNMAPVNAHKSAYLIETIISGVEAHSSVPAWGVNAMVHGASIIKKIEKLGERLAALPVIDDRFFPPHPTVSIGEISGGTAHNIVPNTCRIVWGIRGMPETDVPELIDGIRKFTENHVLVKMHKENAACTIETKIAASILPLAAKPAAGAESLISVLTGDNRMNAVSYGTDAGFFDAVGWPSIVCGPGDIAQAHKPDEFIAIEELSRCSAMLSRLMEKLSQ